MRPWLQCRLHTAAERPIRVIRAFASVLVVPLAPELPVERARDRKCRCSINIMCPLFECRSIAPIPMQHAYQPVLLTRARAIYARDNGSLWCVDQQHRFKELACGGLCSRSSSIAFGAGVGAGRATLPCRRRAVSDDRIAHRSPDRHPEPLSVRALHFFDRIHTDVGGDLPLCCMAAEQLARGELSKIVSVRPATDWKKSCQARA